MKILQVLQACAGGTARHVIDLTEGLLLRGHDITLVYSSENIDDYFKEGLARLEQEGINLFDGKFKRSIGFSDIQAYIFLRKLIRKRGPFDIIHAHSSKAGGLCRLPGMGSHNKVLYSPHAFVTTDPKLSLAKRTLYRLVESFLVKRTTRLISTSDIEYQHALKLGFLSSQISTLYHGVRYQPGVDEDSREKFRSGLGISPSEIVIGFVGRFVSQKAPEVAANVAMNICTQYQNVKFVLVGDGPELETIKTIIDGHERVLIPGYMDVREAMAGFDFYLLTSRYEGFPYVLIDAIMAGNPIIATDVGGVDVVVEQDINGVIVHGENGMIKAISSLINDSEKIKKMQIAALQKAIQFTWESMIDNTEHIYCDVCEQ